MGKESDAGSFGGQPATGSGGGTPKPPELPADAPRDLRDFIECRSANVTVADGALAWVSLPSDLKSLLGDVRPKLTIGPGAQPGGLVVTVTLGSFAVTVPAAVRDGMLSVDTSKLPILAPASVEREILRFVGQLNAWFTSKGVGLAPPAFSTGGVALAKIPLVASGVSAPAAAPGLTTPAPAPAPAPGPGSALPPPSEPLITPTIDLVEDLRPDPSAPSAPIEPLGWSADHDAAIAARPIPPAWGTISYSRDTSGPAQSYAETDVEPPVLVPWAVIDPNGPPQKVDQQVAAGPVAGAGGGGVAAAPKGMGTLVVRYLAAAAIVALLAGGAFVLLGRGAPAGGGPSPSPAGSVGGVSSPVVKVTTGPLPSSGGPVVLNGRWKELSDTKVDSCHHIYVVRFNVVDSNGASAPYAGKPATYQLLDGEAPRSGTLGSDATLEVTLDEEFVKTAAGCHSRYSPRLITVDGMPTY